MKVLRFIAAAVLMLMLAGCGWNEGANGVPDPGEDGPVLLPSETQGEFRGYVFTRLEHAPEYFRPGGWLDRERLIGLSRNEITVFSTESQSQEALGLKAWEVWLAPDRQQIAFNNERGLFVGAVGKGEPVLAVPAEGTFGVPDGVIWSPDSRQLVYRLDHEWDSVHYVLDLDSGAQEELNTVLEGYFMNRAVAWPTQGRIVFQTVASVGQDGTREYTEVGYRGDLAVLDLASGRYELLSTARDGEFLVFQGLTRDQEIVYVLQHLDRGSREWGLMDLAGNVTWVNEIDPEVATVEVVGGQVYFFQEQGLDGDNMRFALSASAEGEWGSAVRLAEITSESGFLTFQPAPDADRAVLGFAVIEPEENGFQTVEYLYLVSWE